MSSAIRSHKDFDDSYINEASLSRIISKFNDWKVEKLQGQFKYKQTKYDSTSTALTNSDGTLKEDIVQGLIGVHIESGKVSDKYLYDTKAYDSPLELKNIRTDVPEVIVYGKIPRRSISIPTIAGSSYSPDFMYVVKKSNGQKELNIVVETKDVEGKVNLRGEEKTKINCAEVFFNQLKIDGYDVHFKTQINNKEMATIISELME
jgi:type III restriction enzyme